jgi:hypothetical protein
MQTNLKNTYIKDHSFIGMTVICFYKWGSLNFSRQFYPLYFDDDRLQKEYS